VVVSHRERKKEYWKSECITTAEFKISTSRKKEDKCTDEAISAKQSKAVLIRENETM
jgi:hypothetical protein